MAPAADSNPGRPCNSRPNRSPLSELLWLLSHGAEPSGKVCRGRADLAAGIFRDDSAPRALPAVAFAAFSEKWSILNSVSRDACVLACDDIKGLIATGCDTIFFHSVHVRTLDARPPTDSSVGSKAFYSWIKLMGAPMPFASNAEIYGENEPAEYVCKILTGTVRTCKALYDGRRQIVAFYLAGDVFDLESGDEHTFSAEAITDCKVLGIERSALVLLAGRDTDVARQLWAMTATELQRAQDHNMLLINSAQDVRGCKCRGLSKLSADLLSIKAR